MLIWIKLAPGRDAVRSRRRAGASAGDPIGRRTGESISPQFQQRGPFLFGLDALGDDLDLESLAHADQGVKQGLVDLVGVSRFTLEGGDEPSITIRDLREEPRCERSWKRDGTVRPASPMIWSKVSSSCGSPANFSSTLSRVRRSVGLLG